MINTIAGVEEEALGGGMKIVEEVAVVDGTERPPGLVIVAVGLVDGEAEDRLVRIKMTAEEEEEMIPPIGSMVVVTIAMVEVMIMSIVIEERGVADSTTTISALHHRHVEEELRPHHLHHRGTSTTLVNGGRLKNRNLEISIIGTEKRIKLNGNNPRNI